MKITCGAVELSWSASSRLLEVRFPHACRATRQEGAALVDILTQSIGTEGQLFGVLADAANVSGLDREYRLVTGDFFEQHRRDCLIAPYHMGAVIRVVAEMFRIGTGTRVKAFAAEAEARAWLRDNGVAA